MWTGKKTNTEKWEAADSFISTIFSSLGNPNNINFFEEQSFEKSLKIAQAFCLSFFLSVYASTACLVHSNFHFCF